VLECEGGAPDAGARRQPLYVKADAAGRFDLVISRAFGTVTLVARRAGSLSAKPAPITLTAARQNVPALKLGEGLKFTGRVVDEQRRPIPAAIVQAVAEVSPSDSTGGISQTVRGQTQRDGSFELAGLDAGGGHPGETTLDFDFGDVQVSGRVTRDGRPAPGVRVLARPLDGQLVFALATTTATGQYSLSNLARGRHSVETGARVSACFDSHLPTWTKWAGVSGGSLLLPTPVSGLKGPIAV